MQVLHAKEKKAAFLVENGFCERELIQSRNVMNKIGFFTRVISVDNDVVKGWNELQKKSNSSWGQTYAVHHRVSDAQPHEYNTLIIPGGVRSITKLKLSKASRPFVSGFVSTGKPVITYNAGFELLTFLDLSEDFRDHKKAKDFTISKNIMHVYNFPDISHDLETFVKGCLINLKQKEGLRSVPSAA